MGITVGMHAEVSSLVEREDTALEVGSGSLLVYATPCMAAMEEGTATVGTGLNLRHTAATPVGLDVRAEAEVTKVEGKVITFSIKAYDEKGEIGSAEHTRVVVNSQRFLEKAYQKL